MQLFGCVRFGSCPDNLTFSPSDGSGTLGGSYTFASTGTSWYTAGNQLPTAPTYASLQPLTAFNGGSLNNTWTLNIQDRNSLDAGSFTQWSFNATPVPFEFSPALGLGVLGSAWLVRKALKKKSKEV